MYPIIEKLEQKGLVSSLSEEGIKYYQAISKEELIEWTKRKQQEYEEKASSFQGWIEEQDASPSLATEVKHFVGYDGVKSLYDESWRNNSDKEILAITDYKKAYEVMGDFFRNDYFRRRLRRDVQVKSILPESEIGKQDIPKAKELLRDMRFLKLFEDLGIELNIYDDKIAIVAFDKKRPTGVIIKNQIMANAFKEIFGFLWNKGKKSSKSYLAR